MISKDIAYEAPLEFHNDAGDLSFVVKQDIEPGDQEFEMAFDSCPHCVVSSTKRLPELAEAADDEEAKTLAADIMRDVVAHGRIDKKRVKPDSGKGFVLVSPVVSFTWTAPTEKVIDEEVIR